MHTGAVLLHKNVVTDISDPGMIDILNAHAYKQTSTSFIILAILGPTSILCKLTSGAVRYPRSTPQLLDRMSTTYTYICPARKTTS